MDGERGGETDNKKKRTRHEKKCSTLAMKGRGNVSASSSELSKPMMAAASDEMAQEIDAGRSSFFSRIRNRLEDGRGNRLTKCVTSLRTTVLRPRHCLLLLSIIKRKKATPAPLRASGIVVETKIPPALPKKTQNKTVKPIIRRRNGSKWLSFRATSGTFRVPQKRPISNSKRKSKTQKTQ